MLGKVIVTSTLIAAIALLILLQTTNPSTIGPIGLLAVFFLLYVIMLGCVTELIYAGSKAVGWVARRLRTRRPPVSLSLQRAYYFSTVIALAPIMMLAMKSIGSLGAYELVLIGLFLGVGILYVSKRASR